MRLSPFQARHSPVGRISNPSQAGFIMAIALLSLLMHGQASEPAGLRSPEEATPESSPAELTVAPAEQQALHLSRLGAERWHRAGFRGQGATIAILDSSFRGCKSYLG